MSTHSCPEAGKGAASTKPGPDRGPDRGPDHGPDHRTDHGPDDGPDHGPDHRPDHGPDPKKISKFKIQDFAEQITLVIFLCSFKTW